MPLVELRESLILKSAFLLHALVDEIVIEEGPSINICYCKRPCNVGKILIIEGINQLCCDGHK
jgi:hypothetical protein